MGLEGLPVGVRPSSMGCHGLIGVGASLGTLTPARRVVGQVTAAMDGRLV